MQFAKHPRKRPKPDAMTPGQLQSAMNELGALWHLGRPLADDELAIILEMKRNTELARPVRLWLRGKIRIPGPVAQLIRAWIFLGRNYGVWKDAKDSPKAFFKPKPD